MRVHPSYGHAGGKQPNMRISERPIRFDARKDMESWTTSYFVDSDWANASDFGLPPAAPWNHLHERPIPLWKNGGLVPYATTDAATPGIVRCSLPYNAQVTPYLKVEAHAGEMIEIDSDDPLNEMHVEYIARDGVQEYEAPAWMNGHNIIYKIPVSVKVLRLLYRESGFDTEFSGSFECDDPFLTTLWKQCARTLYVTMRDNFMDCPDRERGQWWGDAVNEIGETFYSLSPSSASLAQKAIYNLTEWQKPDGTIFSPVPAGNWSTELPTQMLASVGQYGFWTYFLYTGDLKTIKEVYPAVKKYLSVWKIGGDGLVVHRPGGWDWLDWGDNIDVAVLDNAWFALALSGAKSMALAAGYPADSLRYSQMYDALSAAVNRKLWNGTEYREPVHKGPPDDRANGLAVVSGIVSNEKFAAITQLLQEQKWASPYMEKYVLESLVIMGRTDLALKRMHERYKEAVESGLSTLPETFPLGGTMNHAWSGGPLTILSQYVAGIAPIVPGYTSFSIKPNYGGLNHIRAAVDTKRGKIVVQLDRKVKMQTCTVEAPTGSIAYVSLPTGGGNLNSVRVNGVFWKPNSSSPKFKANSYNLVGNRVVFRLSSGRWLIELAD